LLKFEDFDARKHAALRERQLLVGSNRRNRPVPAGRDFLID